MSENKDVPCWERCDLCECFLCNVHPGLHVHDCECPVMEWWTVYDLWPYETTVAEYEKFLKENKDLIDPKEFE